MKPRLTAIALLGGLLLAGARLTAAPTVPQELPALGGSSGHAYAANDKGQVVGMAETAQGENHAFLWDAQHGTQDLGVPGYARYINNKGQITGIAFLDGTQKAFLWENGAVKYLGFDGQWSYPTGLTESGLVVGEGLEPNSQKDAFAYDTNTGKFTTISTGSNWRTDARGVNESGLVIVDGMDNRNANMQLTFAYDLKTNTLTDLGRITGAATWYHSTKVNNAGQVIGYTSISNKQRGFLWDAQNGIQLLPGLGGTQTVALDVNELGQVVGQSWLAGDASSAPVIWENGQVRQLFRPQGTHGHADQINDRGQILGYSLDASFKEHAFLYDSGAVQDITPAVPSNARRSTTFLSQQGRVGGLYTQGDPYSYPYTSTSLVWYYDASGSAVFNMGSPGALEAMSAGGSMVGVNQNNKAFALLAEVAHPPVTTAALAGTQGSAGWYRSDVQVTLSAVAAEGNVTGTFYTVDGGAQQPYEAPFTVSSDAMHEVQYWSTADNGSTEQAQKVTIKIDATAPTLTFGAASPAPNVDGWNGGDVSIPFTTADSLSGVASPGAGGSVTLTGEGSNLTKSVTVTDVAGNSATFTSPAVSIDRGSPSTQASLDGAAGNNGWHRGDVQVTLSATDGGSGVSATYYVLDGGARQTYTAPFTVSGDAVHSVKFWSVDRVGNAEPASTQAVKIDATPPTASFGAPTGAASGNGWYGPGLTVPFMVADNLSGVAAPGANGSLAFDQEGAGQTKSVTVTDAAGNIATFTSPAYNVDLTPPVFEATLNGPGANGWYRGSVGVRVRFKALSGMSAITYQVDGVRTTSPNILNDEFGFTVTGEGVHTVNVGGISNVGLMGSIQPDVRIDQTPPAISFGAPANSPNANGWYNTDVTVPYTVTDSLSGVATPGASGSVTVGEQPLGVTATDKAGNSVTSTPSVQVDKTPPTTIGAQTPNPGVVTQNGWSRGAVTVSLQAMDVRSGVAGTFYMLDGGAQQTYSGPLTISSTGAHLVVYWSTDRAGNQESVRALTVKIDTTAPTVTFLAPRPAANADGWNNGTVSITYTVLDTGSGTSGLNFGVLTFDSEGAGQTQTVTVTDGAGNTTTAVSPAVNIDKTPPQLTYTGAQATYTVDQTVQITLNVTDNLSGVASVTGQSIINAPAYQLAALTGGSSAPFNFQATATDKAGNTASGSVSFQVVVSADGMAAVVRRFCTNAGVANALVNKLEQIQKAPNANAKSGLLQAFVNQVKAEIGKTLTQEQADVLIKMVRGL